MFGKRNPQGTLFQPELLVPPAKARRLEQSWAEVFREPGQVWPTNSRRLKRWMNDHAVGPSNGRSKRD